MFSIAENRINSLVSSFQEKNKSYRGGTNNLVGEVDIYLRQTLLVTKAIEHLTPNKHHCGGKHDSWQTRPITI